MKDEAENAAGAVQSRPVRVSLGLVAATVAAGLCIRFARVGLPGFLTKFGGSALWALMLYWIVSSLSPGIRPRRAGLIAAALAAAVEVFKLYHTPWLDGFRMTLPGILLLGRVFSWQDVAVYWTAIGVGVVVDARLRKRLRLWRG